MCSLLGFAFVLCACQFVQSEKSIEPFSKIIASDTIIPFAIPAIDTQHYYTKHQQAKQYTKAKNWNQDFVILADMHIHSGLPRWFLWSLKDSAIFYSTLVAHGCGNNAWGRDLSKNKPVFSNLPESHCSSLGKYKIGQRSASNWGIGIKYTLYGMEPSNSNALARTIVLHGWDAIPNNIPYPDGVAEGWGCPAVSNQHMQYLDSMLQKQSKPTLLWVFE